MFWQATAFNQLITFSLANALNVDRMFAEANVFYQDLSNLSMPNVTTCMSFCVYCYLPAALQTRCNPCSSGLVSVGAKRTCKCLPSSNSSWTTCAPPFVSVWKTTSPNETITTGWNAIFSSMNVFWDDSSAPERNTESHVYATAGTYTVAIVSGVAGEFDYSGDKLKIYVCKLGVSILSAPLRTACLRDVRICKSVRLMSRFFGHPRD